MTVRPSSPGLPRSTHKRSRRAGPTKTARSKTRHECANPTLPSFFDCFQEMLGVDARGDKLRAVPHHCGEHAFPVEIYERHVAHIHDATAVAIRTVRLFPIRFELRNPRSAEPPLQ